MNTHTPHSSEHTHTVNTPQEQWAAIFCCGTQGAVGGWVPCSRAPQSWYWRWRERCTVTPPTYNSCRTLDLNSQPLGYESDSLTLGHDFPRCESGVLTFPRCESGGGERTGIGKRWINRSYLHWYWLHLNCYCLFSYYLKFSGYNYFYIYIFDKLHCI